VEKFYIRSADLEQKIHSVKLPYLAWKVLFLLGEKQTIESLADILGENEPDVAGAIRVLSENGLIQEEGAPQEVGETPSTEELQSEEAAPAEAAEPESQPEEETPSLEEKSAEEETQPAAEEELLKEAETLPELTEEEEMIAEEEAEEEESFVEESELEEEDEFKGIGDFDLPEVEEESELESQSPEVEDQEPEIEIPQVEEETEKLDIDFDNVEEPVVEEKVVEEKKERLGAPTILVIDDSIVIRKMVELALEGENYILESATSGKEGLNKLDELKPDVVILDLMLPDINGIDLLKTIKASLAIPVIMLSGKDSPQMIEKAKAEGADAFLPKPFRDEDLVKTIHELVQN